MEIKKIYDEIKLIKSLLQDNILLLTIVIYTNLLFFDPKITDQTT